MISLVITGLGLSELAYRGLRSIIFRLKKTRIESGNIPECTHVVGTQTLHTSSCLEAEPECKEEIAGSSVNNAYQDLTDWNTVIMFPEQNGSSEKTNQLIWYLEQAKKEIRVCIFQINFIPLERVIWSRIVQGVHVKVLTQNRSLKQRWQQKGWSNYY